MPGFKESNINLEFPDNRFFRLEKCPAYQKLSSYAFKEMDACWFDINNNTYWLIELKDFTIAEISPNHPNFKKQAEGLVKKSIDCLNIFIAYKHQYNGALHFSECFGQQYPLHATLNLVSIIHCTPSQQPDITHLNNAYRNRFKAYAKLFDLENYAIVEHEMARRLLPFVK